MNGPGPRARAIVTGALMGDPPPGRTPWAAPPSPDEAPRTGMGPATQAQARRVEFTSVDQIRPDDEPVAPKTGEISPKAVSKPAVVGFEGGAELPPINTLRPVQALSFAKLTPADIPTEAPLIEWMEPSALLVEAAYQRDLSPKSTDLIRRIAEGWDWRRFKPPIVAWTERGFEIIDGQHTAIGAATRGIEKIPVLVVEASQMKDRATAFVGHNRDRLMVTPVQMHRAGVAAGDPEALAVQRVIENGGAKLLVGQYGGYKYKPGETIAVSNIAGLIKRRGEGAAARVIRVLVDAESAPVSAPALKAVDMLLHQPEYAEMDQSHLPATIKAAGDIDSQSKLDARTHGIPVWEAMGRIWFRKCKKRRAV